MKKSEIHSIYSRHLKKANPFSLFNFGRGSAKASEKTQARKKERQRGQLFHNPVVQGTYKNKI